MELWSGIPHRGLTRLHNILHFAAEADIFPSAIANANAAHRTCNRIARDISREFVPGGFDAIAACLHISFV